MVIRKQADGDYLYKQHRHRNHRLRLCKQCQLDQRYCKFNNIHDRPELLRWI